MASYSWNSGTGNWDIAGDWTPSGPPGVVPTNGDIAKLTASSSTFTVSILTGETYDLSALQLAGQNASHRALLSIGGTLNTDSVAFQGTFASGGDAGITVDSGGTLHIRQSLSASNAEIISVSGRDLGGHLLLDGTSIFSSNVTFSFLNNGLSAANTGVIEYAAGYTSGLATNQKITNWGIGDTVKFDGADFTGDLVSFNATTHVLTVTSGATTVLTMNNVSGVIGTTFIASGDGISVVCFGSGTGIRTPRGDVAIETLQPGDQVVTLTRMGAEVKAVKWIGRRQVNLKAHPRQEQVAPIRIQRHAFADNVPVRDLIVSPDHAIFVDGKLISARQLVNGTTIAQMSSRSSVVYYHVELDRHAIILAEGLSAESYLDTGNRGFFANGSAPQVLHPNMAGDAERATREAASCAPFVWQEDEVRPVWQKLAVRAAELGVPVARVNTTADADLSVIAAGRTLRPVAVSGDRYQFVLPPGAARVRLTSRTARANSAKPWLEDRRGLGVYVAAIRLRQGGDVIDLPLDHPALTEGWWDLEGEGYMRRRWTSGDALIALPALSASAILEVVASNSGLEYPVEEPQAKAA